jgi:peptide/nickel transport system substrate-binding protein
MHGRRALVAAALCVTLGTGCGGTQPTPPSSGPGTVQAGGGGTLVYALTRRPAGLDPLRARSRETQTVVAQSYEPLVATLAGPFGDTRRRRGLAVAWRSSADREIWSFSLRHRVRFADGTLFDADAVLANAARWRTLPAGRLLVPGLVAADAPSPSEVRFVLNRPTPDLPRLLAGARLGIVSPSALEPRSGVSASVGIGSRAGTGPFRLIRSGGDEILVARNPRWWGTKLGLGPALDQVRFRIVPSETRRAQLLSSGAVQVADGLGVVTTQRVRRDPLLYTLPNASGGALGLERSVRGISGSGPVRSFAGAWLTTVGAG